MRLALALGVLLAACVHFESSPPGEVLVLREGLPPACQYDPVGERINVTTPAPSFDVPAEQLFPSTLLAVKQATKDQGAPVAMILVHTRADASETVTVQPIKCRHAWSTR